jgi:hypothetical protein
LQEFAFLRVRGITQGRYLFSVLLSLSFSSSSSYFAGRIRIDVRGNAVFPHIDRDGVCGYEIKNRSFTGSSYSSYSSSSSSFVLG